MKNIIPFVALILTPVIAAVYAVILIGKIGVELFKHFALLNED